MKGDRHPDKLRMKSTQGFTLIELMVVLVIVGILATGVVFMFANPSAKSKNQAFTMLGEFNMARSEAVSRNEDVLVDFDLVGGNGYQICVDATPVGAPDGDCSTETGDNFIRETLFHKDVKYYAPTALPVDGPSITSGGGDLIGGTGIVLDDDTPITHFTYEPDGTLEDGIPAAINVVVFVPKGSPNVIYGTPYAIRITPNAGRILLERWEMGDDWHSK